MVKMSKETRDKLDAIKWEGYEVTIQICRHEYLSENQTYYEPNEDINIYLQSDEGFEDTYRGKVRGRWFTQKEMDELVKEAIEQWFEKITDKVADEEAARRYEEERDSISSVYPSYPERPEKIYHKEDDPEYWDWKFDQMRDEK